MTEQGYLNMPWGVEDTIENLKEIKGIMIAKVKAVNLHGKAESDAREVAFDFDRAIKALEEIQQYRALGAVEELREAREKQRPYKPRKYQMYCGKCKCGAVFLNKSTRYCGNCGQHLDWVEPMIQELKTR